MRIPLDRIGSITNWSTGETWSRERVRSEALGVAATLRARGAAPGRVVVIHRGGDARFFVDLFGVWLSGACAACLNPGTTAEELKNITDLVEPVDVLAGDRMTARNASSDVDICGGLDDDALILFTSGTTGEPKGVLHSFRSILARVALNQAHISRSALRRSLCVLPTHFGHGLIGNCLTPLLAGHDLVLAPATNLEVSANLGSIIDDNKITFLSSVPTLWKKVVKSVAPPTARSLLRVQVGSAPLSADLWREISLWSGVGDVVNMYGITETANWLAGASCKEFEPEDGLIGRMWGGSAAVLTADHIICGHGEGELLVQSPTLMTAYYKRPDMTAQILRDGWFHTGDIGQISQDGVMRLTGRQKYVINRGGLKVHPEDIDLLLERHDAVREACAFAIPSETEGESVGVAVSLVDGSSAGSRLLRRWCRERISREKVPVQWYVLDEIPKTDRGKLNRAVVAEYCLSDVGDGSLGLGIDRTA